MPRTMSNYRGLLLWSAFGLCMMAGCSREPFKMVPVSGKVTYSDGSLIAADRIVVQFVPQNVAAVAKDAPGAASGEVNVSDGTFSGLTTHKYRDGVIVGRHKVLVMAMKNGASARPSDAVPAKYARPETTPLEADVTGRDDPFTLLIDKK